jgi:hypothetical protein
MNKLLAKVSVFLSKDKHRKSVEELKKVSVLRKLTNNEMRNINGGVVNPAYWEEVYKLDEGSWNELQIESVSKANNRENVNNEWRYSGLAYGCHSFINVGNTGVSWVFSAERFPNFKAHIVQANLY